MVIHNFNITNCAALKYGNQEINPKSGTRQSKYKEAGVSLQRNQLEPDKIIFYDHYESRLPGRVFGRLISKIKSQVYNGGTIFCGAAYIKISVYNQVSFIAKYTSMYKLKFER